MTWSASNPSTWFRQDLAVDETGMPGGNAETVAKEVLDDQGAAIGILTSDDALSVGLMENAYRAAALARAGSEDEAHDVVENALLGYFNTGAMAGFGRGDIGFDNADVDLNLIAGAEVRNVLSDGGGIYRVEHVHGIPSLSKV